MPSHLNFPIVGIVAAIAITTAMDAVGLAMFSALPLMPLAGLFWYLQKFTKQDIGLQMGTPYWHLVATAFPIVAMLILTSAALFAGAVDTSATNWQNVALNVVAGCTIGILMALITEEGFFRGWLWASLERAGLRENKVLAVTTAAFVIWHLSAVLLDTGFDLPLAEVPIYLVNATLIGFLFGYVRLRSGSVVVASVCHAVWNGLAYPFFGFGEKVGGLGITQTHIYGPEVGILGIIVNASLLFLLVRQNRNDR